MVDNQERLINPARKERRVGSLHFCSRTSHNTEIPCAARTYFALEARIFGLSFLGAADSILAPFHARLMLLQTGEYFAFLLEK